MKNETSSQKFGTEDAERVISENLEYIFRAEASAHERRFAHLRERARIIASTLKDSSGYADIMDAVAHFDEASEIYSSMKGEKLEFKEYFSSASEGDAACLSEYSNRFENLYLCKSISLFDGGAYSEKDVVRWISDSERELPNTSGDKKVSFVRGNQSGRAFERFARFVPGVLAEYEEDFKSACEAVACGESTYAIVPVENSLDGRLNSFYRLIEKYALSIVLSADIVSDDGESSTRFALVYKNFEIINLRGSHMFECRITFGHQRELGNIILTADYFGAEICKIYSLPLSSGGRENSFGIIFGIDGADLAGFFCYLLLEYPQFSSVGIYTAIGVDE